MTDANDLILRAANLTTDLIDLGNAFARALDEAAHRQRAAHEHTKKQAAIDLATDIMGWRENDWPEGFCRRTAETMALHYAAKWRGPVPVPTLPPGACAACGAEHGKCDHSPDEWMGP